MSASRNRISSVIKNEKKICKKGAREIRFSRGIIVDARGKWRRKTFDPCHFREKEVGASKTKYNPVSSRSLPTFELESWRCLRIALAHVSHARLIFPRSGFEPIHLPSNVPSSQEIEGGNQLYWKRIETWNCI